MEPLNEALLDAWLLLSTTVVNPRLVSELSYNESLVCYILYRHMRANPEQRLTATDLCRETKILKSQMNRILQQLEQKQFIQRQRSTIDKRQIHIQLNWDKAHAYEAQHQKSLQLVDTIIQELGVDRAKEAIQVITAVSGIVNQWSAEARKEIV